MSIIRKDFLHNGRLSRIVQHNGTLYLCGLVGDTAHKTAREQTMDILAAADKLLAENNSDKSHILSATIFVHDAHKNFAEMNEAWDAWVDRENPPARVGVECNMSNPDYLVEILFIAAVKE